MRHRTAAYLAAAWAIASAVARTRIKDLIPPGASVFTGASETLRLSGIDADINTSGRYQAIRPRVLAMDRVTGAGDISPDAQNSPGAPACPLWTGLGVVIRDWFSGKTARSA
jgi:hypothetical protein